MNELINYRITDLRLLDETIKGTVLHLVGSDINMLWTSYQSAEEKAEAEVIVSVDGVYGIDVETQTPNGKIIWLRGERNMSVSSKAWKVNEESTSVIIWRR